MRREFVVGLIILVFALVMSATPGIAAGQDSGGPGSTGPGEISTDATEPGVVTAPPPGQATAEVKMYDTIEINGDSDFLPNGTYNGRQWGILQITNTPDSSHTVLGNISVILLGDSISNVEFPENAIWNDTSIHWVFPPDLVINESEFLQMTYHTTALTSVYSPVSLSRYVDKSVFASDGNQFNSYEVIFEENAFESYSGRIAYEGKTYSNSSLLFDTFTTDLPLTYLSNGSYLHPITKQYISEINFGFSNSSIQLHRPYHFNFSAAIKPINNSGLPVKIYPRIFLALGHLGPVQDGIINTTAIVPSSLLPAHLRFASVTTNVSNFWQYRHKDDVKLVFNQTAVLLNSDAIAVFRPASGHWYFDYNLDGIVEKSLRFGGSADQIIKGNWQGTERDGIAIFRPASGYWYFDYNLDGIVDNFFRFGGNADRIISGDWQGTGRDGIAIFRPASGYWYFDYNLDGVVNKSFRFGGSTDQIVSGDWDGDGFDTIAIYRPASGYWYFDNNLDGIVGKSFRFGGSADKIVSGDWDGDGKDGIAIFRPASGFWYFDNNLDGVVNTSFRYGGNSDQIISGNWA